MENQLGNGYKYLEGKHLIRDLQRDVQVHKILSKDLEKNAIEDWKKNMEEHDRDPTTKTMEETITTKTKEPQQFGDDVATNQETDNNGLTESKIKRDNLKTRSALSEPQDGEASLAAAPGDLHGAAKRSYGTDACRVRGAGLMWLWAARAFCFWAVVQMSIVGCVGDEGRVGLCVC